MHYHESTIEGVQCIRKYRFEAAHSEYNGLFDLEENYSIYGHHSFIHGHNYELHILLQGQEDKDSGMVVELSSIDEIVNINIVDKFDHQQLTFEGGPTTHEFFAKVCSGILQFYLPYYHGLIIVEDPNQTYTKIIEKESPMVYKTQIIEFSAAHSLNNPKLSKKRNQEIFGKCQRLHGHNYKLSVTVKGTPNTRTGVIITPISFEKMVRRIVSKYDYQKLHELADFDKKPPTTENLIKELWDGFQRCLVYWGECFGEEVENYWSKDLELDSITLQETDRNIFVYKGE